MVRMTTEEE